MRIHRILAISAALSAAASCARADDAEAEAEESLPTVADVLSRYDTDSSGSLSLAEVASLRTALGLDTSSSHAHSDDEDHSDDETHSDEEHDDDHRLRRKSLFSALQAEKNTGIAAIVSAKRIERAERETAGVVDKGMEKKRVWKGKKVRKGSRVVRRVRVLQEEVECFPNEELLELSDANGDGVVGAGDELSSVLPALVLMRATGSCSTTTAEEDCSPSTSERWGAGIGSVVAISLLSFVGVLLLPLFGEKKVRQIVLPAFVAFGAGSIATSAVSVLLPEAYGLHSHGGGAHDHAAEEEEDEDSKLYLKRSTVALAGLVFFYALQQIFRLAEIRAPLAFAASAKSSTSAKKQQQRRGAKRAAGSAASAAPAGAAFRSAGAVDLDADDYSDYVTDEASYDGDAYDEESYTGSSSAYEDDGAGAPVVVVTDVISSEAAKPAAADAAPAVSGWINIAADAVHNLTDGLVIGALYSQSLSTGFAVTVSVFVHELAQEFGDFAFLIHNGFSRTRALLFNLLSGVFAIFGAILGLAIGSSTEDAVPWISAFSAGGFLFVSLSLMLPELLKTNARTTTSLVNQGSFLFGMLVTFIVIFYVDEEAISSGDC